MSVSVPTYMTCFKDGDAGVTHGSLSTFPISAGSFVAFKVSLAGLNGTVEPSVSVTVRLSSTNMLGNTIGMLGLYEMSDSNWIGSDMYSEVDSKVDVSPIAVSNPIADFNCDGYPDDTGPVKFIIPETVIKRWKRRNLSQVSLALATYGEFECEGYLTIGSNESDNPIEIEIKESGAPSEEPFDVVVNPITLVPTGRATVTISSQDRVFENDTQDIVVTLDGEPAEIVSGNDCSLKIVVPNLPDTVEGMVELLISDSGGNQLSNPTKVYYDASSTRRNKIFAAPSRPGRENERASHSAVYNRDIGFNNFAEITDENSLVQNIYNILLTRKGERLFNPDFGTTIEERVFSIMNEDDETSILQECFTAIHDYEPRVSVDYEESKVDIDYDANTIRIIIAVVLPNGNSEYIVLPFKSRGTLVR